jgi:WD40 repeat protein
MPNGTGVLAPGIRGSRFAPPWARPQHSGYVSGIDWSHQHNQLATCAHDRNAYVWRYDEKKDEWRPTLVLLHIDRAATAVKWSPCGVCSCTHDPRPTLLSPAQRPSVSCCADATRALAQATSSPWRAVRSQSPSATSSRRTTGGSPR